MQAQVGTRQCEYGRCRAGSAAPPCRLSLVPSLQQCKYLHVLGDDALPSSAAHCAHTCCAGAGTHMASHLSAHGVSASTSGVCLVQRLWAHVGCTIIHTHPLMGGMCHIIMLSREALVSASCGMMQSVLVGCSTLAGQPLVTFASEAARAAVRTCAVEVLQCAGSQGCSTHTCAPHHLACWQRPDTP